MQLSKQKHKDIRRLIYTTNAIEGFNRQLCKVTITAAKNAVPGHDGYHEKVDRPPAGLEYDSYSDGSLFGGEDARITENCLHIKAKIRKTPVFVVEVTPKS